MKTVDARGLPCPKPTVMVKNEMDAGEEHIEVTVDNPIARDNLLRLAGKMGYSANVSQKKDDYVISMVLNKEADTCASHASSVVYFFRSETVGVGDDKLGELLMKAMLYTLTEQKPTPTHLIFMNGGVKLVAEGSEHAESIKALEALGCQMLICGTCLDYFGLKDKVIAGTVSNMYDILDVLSSTTNVVSI